MFLQTYLTGGFILSASMISFIYVNDSSIEFNLKSIGIYTILGILLLMPLFIIAFLLNNRLNLNNPLF